MVAPYLNFSGDCEQALQLYARAFGGKILHMVKYGDMPENPEMPLNDTTKNQVMHAFVQLTENGGVSAADAIWKYEKGSAINIHVNLKSEAQARKAFAALAEQGTIIGEIAENPPPDNSGLSGMVEDKFGFRWVISALKDQ